jgi:ribosomal protein S18 acetylase RimI-like enzyme
MSAFCSSEEFEKLYRDVSRNAGIVRFQARGGSMWPLIQSGDWVLLAPNREGGPDVRIGDIVLVKRPEGLCMHRVVKRVREGIMTKGDVSFGHDGITPPEDILGKAVAVERGARRIDLTSGVVPLVGAVIAKSGLISQYPALAIRKAAGLFPAVLGAVQSLRLYRTAAKKTLKAAITVSAAREEDEEELRDLYLMNGADIRQGLKCLKGEGLWLVARIGGRIAGGLTASRSAEDPSLWLIFGLEVKPVLRGLGAGEALVKKAIDSAREDGAARMGLFVKAGSTRAVRLYKKLGFSNGAVPPAGYHKQEDELYLSADITPPQEPAFFARLTPEEAQAEGVFYPFYRWFIRTRREEGLPEALRERHENIYYLHLAEGAKYSAAAKAILGHLDAVGVKAILLKGLAIDDMIYDGYARPRIDIDIVVRDDDIPLVRRTIGEDAVSVHLHIHVINNTFLTYDGFLRIDMDSVWRRTEPFSEYKNIRALNPELNILYLCEHGLKHDFDQLVYLYEISRLIDRYGARLDWDKFLALAREYGMARIVYYGLYLAKEMTEGAIPEQVLAALRPARMTSGEKKFIRYVLDRKCRRYSSYFVYLAARETTVKKAIFLFRTVFPRRSVLP